MNLNLDDAFKAAVRIVSVLPKTGTVEVSDEEKLSFYSYYKQAVFGDNKNPKPKIWDLVNRIKWDYWNTLKGMSQEEAKIKYIQKLRKCFKDLINSNTLKRHVDSNSLEFINMITKSDLETIFGDIKIPDNVDLIMPYLKSKINLLNEYDPNQKYNSFVVNENPKMNNLQND